MPLSLVEGSNARDVREFPGLVQHVFRLASAEIIVNEMAAGASLPMHEHAEAQFGFALRSAFTLVAEDAELAVDPVRGYELAGWVRHGAWNRSQAVALTLDVKLVVAGSEHRISVVTSEPRHGAKEPTRFCGPWVTAVHFGPEADRAGLGSWTKSGLVVGVGRVRIAAGTAFALSSAAWAEDLLAIEIHA